MNLYNRLGEELVKNTITEFYVRAFRDPIIGHFFRGKNRAELTLKQIDFVSGLLGGPKRYTGRPLELAHEEFSIRNPHFDRRQMLMREVLHDMNCDQALTDEWLAVEEKFRELIVTVKTACLEQKHPTV